MGAKFDIRRYSAAEMVLLGIFALGLILASFVARYRNRIILTEPIELKLSGVSVSVPTGGGWQSTQEWDFNQREGVFVLSGHLIVGRQIGAIVQWRYLAVSENLLPEQRLSMQAGADELKIVEAGRIEGIVAMDWARARLRNQLEETFLGTARVDQEAVVELQVVAPADGDFAGRLFRLVAASLRFVQPDLSKRTVTWNLQPIGKFSRNNIDYKALLG